MQNNKLNILSTRPLKEETLQHALQAGVNIDVENFIETNSIIDQDIAEEIKKYAYENVGIVFTSMNAVEAVADVLDTEGIIPEWNIFAMGNTTKKLVAKYFPESTLVATGSDATELAQAIIEHADEEVVFFCGDQRRDELPHVLEQHGLLATEVTVYETTELPVTITKPYDGILFFSPSAVHSFFSVNKPPKQTTLFAIGNTTAKALSKQSPNKIVVADEPDKERLALKAVSYLSGNN